MIQNKDAIHTTTAKNGHGRILNCLNPILKSLCFSNTEDLNRFLWKQSYENVMRISMTSEGGFTLRAFRAVFVLLCAFFAFKQFA